MRRRVRVHRTSTGRRSRSRSPAAPRSRYRRESAGESRRGPADAGSGADKPTRVARYAVIHAGAGRIALGHCYFSLRFFASLRASAISRSHSVGASGAGSSPRFRSDCAMNRRRDSFTPACRLPRTRAAESADAACSHRRSPGCIGNSISPSFRRRTPRPPLHCQSRTSDRSPDPAPVRPR